MENILAGAGSSDLIFRALPHWLTPRSRVLILDPTYGEYAHVLERVIGCRVDRLTLDRFDQYDVDPSRLETAIGRDYDLVVLVNPNSPTGPALDPTWRNSFAPEELVEDFRVSGVDGTYVEYAGRAIARRDGRRSENIMLQIDVQGLCPPWPGTSRLPLRRTASTRAAPGDHPPVGGGPARPGRGRPGGTADVEYYAARHAETASHRERLAARLREFDWEIIPGVANFLLADLPEEEGPESASLVEACREKHLFLKGASAMGTRLGRHAIRLAVKDAATNDRMIEIIATALGRVRGQ